MWKSTLPSKTRLMPVVLLAAGLAVAQDRPSPRLESSSAAAETIMVMLWPNGAPGSPYREKRR